MTTVLLLLFLLPFLCFSSPGRDSLAAGAVIQNLERSVYSEDATPYDTKFPLDAEYIKIDASQIVKSKNTEVSPYYFFSDKFDAAHENCHIVGIEMQPRLFHSVEMSVRLSGFSGRAHLYNRAVWYRSGRELSFTPFRKNFGYTRLNRNRRGKHVVKTTRVDRIISNKQVNIFFLKLDIERSEEQALIGMNTLFLNRRVEHALFECESVSEFEVFFDIGYGCSVIDMAPKCYYGDPGDAPSMPHHDADLVRAGLQRYPLPRECFFYNRDEAEKFYDIHKSDPGKDKKAYYNIHCFLRQNATVSMGEVIRREADKYAGQLLRYEEDLFEVVDRGGRPYLREVVLEGGRPSSSRPIVNATFRTMFLIESELT